MLLSVVAICKTKKIELVWVKDRELTQPQEQVYSYEHNHAKLLSVVYRDLHGLSNRNYKDSTNISIKMLKDLGITVRGLSRMCATNL